MEVLGYYAMNKDKDLFQFTWTEDDKLVIDGVIVSPDDFEIVEIAILTSDYENE
jgi:hypothetical protein